MTSPAEAAFAVSACGGCGGTWADLAASQAIAASAALELEKIDDIVGAHARGSAARNGPRICPVCGDELARVVFAQTELDACTRHGTFFDRAELGRVVRIVERKRQLADPSWSSGDDMHWVSGTTSLTRPPPLDAEELRDRQSAQSAIDLGALVGRLWRTLRRAPPQGS